MSHYCEKCGRTLDDTQFYTSNNLEKYPPDGKLNQCKKCLTLLVDNWEPETYLWILQEVDVPYIKEEWDGLLEKYGQDPKKLTGLTILGRYLSKMKLKQWREYRWEDSERITEEKKQKAALQMKAQGYSDELIKQELERDRTPVRPDFIAAPVGEPGYTDLPQEPENDEFADSLSDEDKIMLRLKWGKGYRVEEYVRLEQLYRDFMNSYDVQAAGHKDTLIKICKTSLKADELLDLCDIDGAQKMIKMYNDLMKQGNFTAVQNKQDNGNFVDSLCEFIAMCEEDGYIEKFYITKDNDKVDETISDNRKYIKSLIESETNLTELLEGAIKEIQKEDEEDKNADDIFALDDIEEDITAQIEDYEEFADFLDEEEAIDEESLKSFMGDDV